VFLTRLRPITAAGALLLLSLGHPALALDGKAIVAERCASCHDTTGPAPSTLDGVLGRKAPDLFYAGSKFNRSWLVGWLKSPTLIRQAGTMFLDHIAVENGKDTIRADSVEPCPANLSPDEAVAVADYLMTLTDPAMATGAVGSGEKFSEPQAYRLFSKQLPCIGCHTVKRGKRTLGGVSGPSLTDAGDRLNPDWVYARIENPQYWDPKTWMPRIEMSHKKRELLTLFIGSMR
jgi:mono/diheme cytochrome c family protein